MKTMNAIETKQANGGIGYFGAKFTCGICHKTQRVWDWQYLWWSKETCQSHFESQHYNNAGCNFNPNVHS